jgi:RNA polymerase sigma factor (sigma-70 family)
MPPPAEGFASRLFLGPALRTQPDRRLVTLVREGYETAFEEIVRRYGKPLSRYAASIVGGRSEDVTQDAFSKALLALRRDDAEIELRPWLFRIVRNAALNDLRDSPPSPEILAEAIVGGSNPAEELERREELADLMKRLQALPEPQRAAIVMRELEGLGHEEIAAALGLTGGGARQAIYRARQALRDGAGMLIPLPLLQAMLAGSSSGVAETAAGAAGVSAAGVSGAAGAGIALKATAATVLVAGAVGAGVALKDNPRSSDAKAAPARVSQSGASQAPTPAFSQDTSSGQGAVEAAGGDRRGRGSGEAELGDDRGGRGETEPGDDHGGEHELVDDHRGHGGRGEAELGDDHGGRDGSSERDGGSSGPGGGDRSGSSGGSGHGGSSGSGSGSGSGHGGDSGSGHGGSSSHGGSGPSGGSGSGSGSSGSGDDGSASSEGSSGGGPEPVEEPTLDDSGGSGSGSGSDGSGSGSGSGSGGGSSGGGDLSEAPS